MKIEIKSVTKGAFDLVETNEPIPVYRRYVESFGGIETIRYEHLVGDGWLDYPFTEFLDEAYGEWTKKQNQDTKTNGNL